MTGYLLGPMRGIPDFNFPAFDRAAKLLRADGHKVISPAEHDRQDGFDETNNDLTGFDMRAAILWDLEQIVNSECVWRLPGWQNSSGCKVELALADFLDLPILEAPNRVA
jgi:hypothetical protein